MYTIPVLGRVATCMYVLVCHEYICGYVPVESIDGGRIDIDRACTEALDIVGS